MEALSIAMMEEKLSNVQTVGSNTEKKKRHAKVRPVPTHAVSVRKSEMMLMLGIGSTKADELIKTGKVKSVLIGRTRLISVRSIEALVNHTA